MLQLAIHSSAGVKLESILNFWGEQSRSKLFVWLALDVKIMHLLFEHFLNSAHKTYWYITLRPLDCFL